MSPFNQCLTFCDRFHPDKNSDPEAEEKFKHFKEAYDVLGDEENRFEFQMSHLTLDRKKYDTYGKSYFTEGRGGGGGMDAADIFSAFFGGGRSSYVNHQHSLIQKGALGRHEIWYIHSPSLWRNCTTAQPNR